MMLMVFQLFRGVAPADRDGEPAFQNLRRYFEFDVCRDTVAFGDKPGFQEAC